VNLSEVFLGLIALAVLAMAGVQVTVFVLMSRIVRDLGETVRRLEQDVRPIVANVQAMSADAARATAMATAQVERAERLLSDASKRVEDTMSAVQHTILGPARDAVSVFQGVKAAFSAFRDLKGRSRSRPATAPVAVPDPPADDDHASFIG
jgi:outer membrane murein-binding lipoprotein Lpp